MDDDCDWITYECEFCGHQEIITDGSDPVYYDMYMTTCCYKYMCTAHLSNECITGNGLCPLCIKEKMKTYRCAACGKIPCSRNPEEGSNIYITVCGKYVCKEHSDDCCREVFGDCGRTFVRESVLPAECKCCLCRVQVLSPDTLRAIVHKIVSWDLKDIESVFTSVFRDRPADLKAWLDAPRNPENACKRLRTLITIDNAI
jgi:hypothetical protein